MRDYVTLETEMSERVIVAHLSRKAHNLMKSEGCLRRSRESSTVPY
jgi:hypothetical protein